MSTSPSIPVLTRDPFVDDDLSSWSLTHPHHLVLSSFFLVVLHTSSLFLNPLLPGTFLLLPPLSFAFLVSNYQPFLQVLVCRSWFCASGRSWGWRSKIRQHRSTFPRFTTMHHTLNLQVTTCYRGLELMYPFSPTTLSMSVVWYHHADCANESYGLPAVTKYPALIRCPETNRPACCQVKQFIFVSFLCLIYA